LDISLKQRLAGAVVIIALGVIFIPLLLDGAGMKEYRRLKLHEPEKPRYDFPVVVPEKPLPKAAPASESPAQSESEKAEATVRDTKSAVKRKGTAPRVETPQPAALKPAFVVQLASFSQRANAATLVSKLQKAGFEAFIETSRISGRKMYRVKVGPMLRREDAVRVRDRLQKKFGLKGTIQNWRPAGNL